MVHGIVIALRISLQKIIFCLRVTHMVIALPYIYVLLGIMFGMGGDEPKMLRHINLNKLIVKTKMIINIKMTNNSLPRLARLTPNNTKSSNFVELLSLLDSLKLLISFSSNGSFLLKRDSRLSFLFSPYPKFE